MGNPKGRCVEATKGDDNGDVEKEAESLSNVEKERNCNLNEGNGGKELRKQQIYRGRETKWLTPEKKRKEKKSDKEKRRK